MGKEKVEKRLKNLGAAAICAISLIGLTSCGGNYGGVVGYELPDRSFCGRKVDMKVPNDAKAIWFAGQRFEITGKGNERGIKGLTVWLSSGKSSSSVDVSGDGKPDEIVVSFLGENRIEFEVDCGDK